MRSRQTTGLTVRECHTLGAHAAEVEEQMCQAQRALTEAYRVGTIEPKAYDRVSECLQEAKERAAIIRERCYWET